MKATRGLWLFALISSAACGDSRSTPGTRVDSLAQIFLDSLDGNRQIISTVRLRRLDPRFDITLPDSLVGFSLSTPVALSVGGSDGNLIAVGDRTDRAIHLFRTNGAYDRTVFGGGRDTSALMALISVAVNDQAEIVATDLWNGTLIRYPAGASHGESIRLTPPVPRGGLGSQVVLTNDGAVYEQWFTLNVPVNSALWTRDLPLVRQLSSEGQVLTSFGTVTRYPGVAFTAALNRGIIAVADDTLWYARRADCRLLAYAMNSPGPRPVRVVEAPLFYRMNPPREHQAVASAGGSRPQVSVQEHCRAFAVDDAGFFYLGQSVGWPETASGLFRPRTALTVLDHEGGYIATYGLGYEILSLAVTRDLLLAILLDTGRHKRIVRAFPNPALDRAQSQRWH